MLLRALPSNSRSGPRPLCGEFEGQGPLKGTKRPNRLLSQPKRKVLEACGRDAAQFAAWDLPMHLADLWQGA